MLVTPINLNNDFKRYQKLDDTTVLDTVLNKIYQAEKPEELVNRLNTIGKMNADIINNGQSGKLLNVNV